MSSDKENMRLALKEALQAYEEGEVPIGAVLVDNESGILVCKNHNRIEQLQDATAHAEILVLREASAKLKRRRLKNCTLYVTVEPCPMCAGAIINSRIKNLFIGAMDEKGGAVGSKLNLLTDYKFNHSVNVHYDICKDEASNILKQFFKELRNKKLDSNIDSQYTNYQ